MAVPGVFAPLETDDRIYVDGGLVRNFPVDVVHTLGVDVVIGVKLEANPPTREQISSVLGTAAQMINILIAQNEQVSLGEMDPKRDVLVTPQLGDIGGGDFARAAEAIATGVEAARRASAQLARYSVSEAEYAAWREAAANRLASVERIDAVRVEGLKRVNPKLFAPLVETHQGRALERPRLEQDLSRLYGHGDFERVSYRFEREAGRDLLIVDAVEKGWGPGYLSFGLGIATDFSGDNRFGLRGTYRHTWVNNLGAEWMSELTTGNDARLFSEFYQPLDADRLAFVAPYVDVSRAPFGVFLEDQRVARYELTRARAGVDVGTTVKSAAELRVGVYTGVADAEVDTGSPLVPEVNANESGFRARLLYDTRDSGGAPRTGRLLLGEVRAPTPALGAEDEYARTEVAGGAAFSSGPNTILLKGLGGTSFGEEMPYYDQFPLGGFLELSGYANEQFRGNEYAFGSVVYYRQLASLPPPIGRGLYLGGSLEVGRLWGVFEGLNPEKTRYGGSLFFAADTWLGPAYLGLGLSGEGDTAVYFLLGNP
jgi:NTE family protein